MSRLPCSAGVCTHDTYTVAQHRLTDDVELQEAEARSRWRGLGSEAKVGLMRLKRIRPVPRSHWPASEKRFSVRYFLSLILPSKSTKRQSGPTALRGQGCVIQTRPRIASAAALKARSNLVSKDLVGGLWCPRQVWWNGVLDGVGPGGIAHMYQNVSCSALLCRAALCLCSSLSSRSRSRSCSPQLQWPVRRMRFEA